MKQNTNELGITYNEFHLNLNKQLDLAYKKLYGKFSNSNLTRKRKRDSKSN